MGKITQGELLILEDFLQGRTLNQVLKEMMVRKDKEEPKGEERILIS